MEETKDTLSDQEKFEEYLLDNMDKIDSAADKIYYAFRSFGWQYAGVSENQDVLEKNIPSRDDIERNITNLIKDSLREEGLICSGRIAVDTCETLTIYLEV